MTAPRALGFDFPLHRHKPFVWQITQEQTDNVSHDWPKVAYILLGGNFHKYLYCLKSSLYAVSYISVCFFSNFAYLLFNINLITINILKINLNHLWWNQIVNKFVNCDVVNFDYIVDITLHTRQMLCKLLYAVG